MLESSEKQKKTEGKTEQDIIEMIDATHGPIIEIGGPTGRNEVTNKSYDIVDVFQLKKRVIPTNIMEGVAVWDYNEEVDDYIPIGSMAAEARIDGRKMAFKSNSVGAIFASALPTDIRTTVLTESFRVLEPGGVVVWQYGTTKDIKVAVNLGFELIKKNITQYLTQDCIFRKPFKV